MNEAPREIWKYQLVLGEQAVEMPRDSKALHVAVQHGHLCLWAVVSPDEPQRRVKILVVGTGHPIDKPSSWEYVGSLMLEEGALVLHVLQGLT